MSEQVQNGVTYYKMNQKIIINNLYQAIVVRDLAIDYWMLGKKLLKIMLPSTQKFDLEDTGKLVAIVAASEMM